MGKLFSFLIPSSNVPLPARQLVYITNILSVICSALTLILFSILYGLFGWLSSFTYTLLAALTFLSVTLINRKNWNVGRLVFCLTPAWMTLFITIYGKTIESDQSYITFFDSRFILLAATILPAIVFKLKERVKITFCLASTFICLSFYDPIHNAIGVGYYQRGFSAPSYYYINFITIISYFVLAFGIVVLKSLTEKAEQDATVLINEKDRINQQLVTQNEELQKKQGELSANREMLQQANTLIDEQQQKLIIYNTHLQALVVEKSKSLIQSNQELAKHNNELQQFSYTISHNLRGPVARLLGLSTMIKSSQNEAEQKQILNFIYQSTLDLDGVLRDLNHIIDIRYELYSVREKVILQEEWNKVLNILGENVVTGCKLLVAFDKAPFVYTIRAMLHSILYNLLSNAIKYRAPDRPLIVKVSSYQNENNEVILEVEDNGLGIDLPSQQQNVFKLYKRFHTHVMGKGLGLFLVKTQVETLNGEITVSSQINIGTLFRITLPIPPTVDKQIFFESKAAKLYYDANLNNTVLIWKKGVTSPEYRDAFESLLKTLKTYNTPGWIADLRLQGQVTEQDQIWFLTYVLPEAVRNGLKRIGAIGFKDPVRASYYEKMTKKVTEFGIDLQVFSTFDEAHQWMESYLFAKATV